VPCLIELSDTRWEKTPAARKAIAVVDGVDASAGEGVDGPVRPGLASQAELVVEFSPINRVPPRDPWKASTTTFA
jgi:hypothetical protein